MATTFFRHLAHLLIWGMALSTATAAEPTITSTGPITHIVILNFHEGTTEAKISEVNRQIETLQGQIPGLLSAKNHPELGISGKSNGADYICLMTFENLEAVKAYNTHPAHLELVKTLKPIIAKPTVLDIATSSQIPSSTPSKK